VSRGREYGADASGAALTGDPEALAQALEQLDVANSQNGIRARLSRSLPGSRGRVPSPAPAANPAFAHLYIVNPLSGRSLGGLFSTHPPIAERVQRLREMTLREARRAASSGQAPIEPQPENQSARGLRATG
jgi:heat shock protein HtpX